MKTPLEQARKLVLTYDFSKVNFDNEFSSKNEYKAYYDNLRKVEKPFDEVTSQVLHDSLLHFIGIEEADDAPDILGYSKEGGYPHLPADWEKPKGWGKYLFNAQLNIADFKLHDVENIFPESGIIYIFQHEDEGDCKIFFYQGAIEDLVERDEIEVLDEDEHPMEFVPGWLFAVRGDHEHGTGIFKLVPDDLKENIDQLLNCKMTKMSDSWGIQVHPSYWQGENEDWDERVTEISDKVLLYQTEIGDATIHTWIDKNDLRDGKFEKAYQTFSGT